MENEARLIRRIQKNGSRTDADALVRQYYDEIFVYVWRQTSDKDIALDLAQEIFMAALRAIRLYDPRKAGFRTWLYSIATNKLTDTYRSRATKREWMLEKTGQDSIADPRDSFRQIESRELLAKLQTRVNEMDIDSQRIFRLKCFGEQTFAQIAVILDMSEAAVKSRYYRLIKILREEFGDEYDNA